MFILKFAGKILLLPVWLILFVIGLAVKMTVQTYAVVRGILAFYKLLLSIIGNEYQKNLFRTGIKASPGIGQKKTERRMLFWKMQLLRCLRWHSSLEQPEA